MVAAIIDFASHPQQSNRSETIHVPHAETIHCVEKATTLLAASETADSLRYASLQLRMAIEYLFYELVPLYQDELPDDLVVRTWQPKQIIEAILECNPSATDEATLTFSDRSSPDNSRSYFYKPPSLRLIKDHWHKLGSFLHAPVTLEQPDSKKWRRVLEEAVATLSQYTSAQILHNFGRKVEVNCICGRTIKRSYEGVKKTGQIRCPDPKCSVVFSYLGDSKDQEKGIFELQIDSYACPYCEVINEVPLAKIKDGLVITCCECKKRVQVHQIFKPVPLDGEPGNSLKESP